MRHRTPRFAIGLLLGWLTSGFAGSATLTWEAPILNDDGTPLTDLAGHIVHYGTANGAYTDMLDVGAATSAAVSGLTADLTYFFAVTAYDHSGNTSVYSAEVSKTIPAEPPGDTTPPTVAILVPPDGSTVPRRGTIVITAEASDDVGVVEVVVTARDGATVIHSCTDVAAPFTCTWPVPSAKNKTYGLQAVATDQAGNVGESAVVHVTAQ